MKKRFLAVLLMAAGLIATRPALASEDSAEYPFPEGFTFDDLPDLPPPEDDEISAENKTPSAPVVPDEKPDIETDLSEETNKQKPSSSGTVSAAGKIVREPKSDFFMPQAGAEEPKDAFDKDKSLTQTLKENKEETGNRPLQGTWVEKLASSAPLSILASENKDGNSERTAENPLEELVKGARKKDERGKTNASVFDISGVMLRMNLQQTERTLENRGFRKVNAKFQIPNFIKWRNEETCRNNGIVGYERLEACVVDLAKKEKHQYLQYLKYAKFDSKEEIEVYFTSNFTENKVYKIVYRSRIASITGNSPKAVYLHNLKVYDFWKKINQKYGHPDNKANVIWGLGGDKPFLKASTGYLMLEDPMFREMDYTRMSREDQRFINSDFYNF